eukprot:747192-Hanusia_phi.AAC.2
MSAHGVDDSANTAKLTDLHAIVRMQRQTLEKVTPAFLDFSILKVHLHSTCSHIYPAIHGDDDLESRILAKRIQCKSDSAFDAKDLRYSLDEKAVHSSIAGRQSDIVQTAAKSWKQSLQSVDGVECNKDWLRGGGGDEICVMICVEQGGEGGGGTRGRDASWVFAREEKVA